MRRAFDIRLLISSLMLAVVVIFAALNPVSARAQASAAAPPGLSLYKLGTGDVISVRVFGEDDMSRERMRLSDAGSISYPILGEIRVNGMTVGELETYITERLRGRYLKNPKVAVSVEEYRPFYVQGEVQRPGGYPYIPGLTIRRAISLAGGLKEKAALNKIYVVRENGKDGKPEKAEMTTEVFPGDTVQIEETYFYIYGMVERPGGYPYQQGLTVRRAAAIAGGFKERASMSKITVVSESDNAQAQKKVDLTTSVEPGDTINVGETFF